MSHSARPDWERPDGVCSGNWEYINDESIASGYDDSLSDSPLVVIDHQVLQKHLPDSVGTAIDFGCGTGRNSIPLIKLGWSVVGIDLSLPMLKAFRSKIPNCRDHRNGVVGSASFVQANLVQLSGLGDSIGDVGYCLFSTFGMIQGRQHRQQFLNHAKRILKPGASLVIHAHNYWRHLRIRGGVRWMVRNVADRIRGRCEVGDRFADYRAVTQMMLHHFSLREFRREISMAGFHVTDSYAILPDETATTNTRAGRFGRAIGWIVVVRCPG